MKKILLYLIISTALFACTAPSSPSTTAAPTTSSVNKTELETKLKGMEASWNLSQTDKDHGVKTVTEIISDDFGGFNDKGDKQNKADILKSLTDTKETITEVVNGEMSLTFYSDNVAAIVGSHVTKGKDLAGKAFSKTTSWTDTYMERNGKWQCIASGSSSHP